jgi:hypothetical protein
VDVGGEAGGALLRAHASPIEFVDASWTATWRAIFANASTDGARFDDARSMAIQGLVADGVELLRGDAGRASEAAHALRTHVYIVDTTPPDLLDSSFWSADAGIASDVPSFEWEHAFTWLRRTYGTSPCVTFLTGTSYARLRERAPPAFGRGERTWHPDHLERGDEARATRAPVAQALDFVAALRAAGAASPDAHVLLWEDDAVACGGALGAFTAGAAIASQGDPMWAAFRGGAGSTAVLLAADVVAQAAVYAQTRRGSDGVDVSLWRFAHGRGAADYAARRVLAAHRGAATSLAVGSPALWAPSRCGAPLDLFWGSYGECAVGAEESFEGVWTCSRFSAFAAAADRARGPAAAGAHIGEALLARDAADRAAVARAGEDRARIEALEARLWGGEAPPRAPDAAVVDGGLVALESGATAREVVMLNG